MLKLAAILCLVAVAIAEPAVYFQEKFDDADWESKWVESTHKGSEAGKFKWTAGKFYGDADKDKGIQTSTDARFYALSSKFDKPFSNEGKTVVVQFTVKHEQNIDCGGGYAKIFSSELDQKDMHGETPYHMMFGPDICGPGTKKVHVIFNYKGKNLLVKKDIRCKDDVFTHLYTLIVRSDNTYEVKIDNKKVESGSLEEDWDFLAAKTIKDPEAKKPDDWDENETVADPEDVKPEDWEQPEHVADPDAKKPDDWDDEMDGEWEPPMIDNPDYKGEWKPKQIPNPAYKGKWVHPEIDNPEYVADDQLYKYDDIGALGFDLWQVKAGTIFDNVLITDDEKFAEEQGDELWGVTKDAEKKMKDEQDEEDRKRREEEEKERKDQEGDEEEEDEEDDEPLEDGDDMPQEKETEGDSKDIKDEGKDSKDDAKVEAKVEKLSDTKIEESATKADDKKSDETKDKKKEEEEEDEEEDATPKDEL